MSSTTQGRSVGTFCDSGINGKEIGTLLRRRNRPTAYVMEFEKLDRLLNDLILKRKVVDYIRADENSRPLVSEDGERLQLLAIGPGPVALKQSARAAVSRGNV